MFLKRELINLTGPTVPGEEDEGDLVWSDNCGSEGQMAFSGSLSKCRCLNHNQWASLHT